MRIGVLVTLVLSSFLFSGCTSSEANLLEDPGFEQGSEAWFWLEEHETWQGFERVADPVHDGDFALRTHIEASEVEGHSLVSGAVQEVRTSELPRTVSGWFRVDTWEPAVERSYVQLVVGLFPENGSRIKGCGALDEGVPCQLAYILAGYQERPLELVNRRYVFVAGVEPALGWWVPIDYPLRDHFEQAYGGMPSGFERIWVYLETRYDADAQDAGAGTVRLETVWDELYLGERAPGAVGS